MKITISVTEFLRVCKAIKLRPERIYKLMRSEIRNSVGEYLKPPLPRLSQIVLIIKIRSPG